MPRNFKQEEVIARVCRSGKYDSITLPSGRTLNKCNLFLDDILKSQWNIYLPRHGEHPIWGKTYPGWEDRPAMTSVIMSHLKAASELSKSGVRRVGVQKAASLALQGKPVVALDGTHAALFAPSNTWPTIYRSDLSGRHGDRRTQVGLNLPTGYATFHIDPKQYREFRKARKIAKPGD